VPGPADRRSPEAAPTRARWINCLALVQRRTVLTVSVLDALSLLVRPLHLHGVAGDLLEAPGADVADFTVHVVVPPGAGNRVGDRLAQLVGTGSRHRVQRRKTAQASSAGRVRHHRVVRLAGVVVIAAVALAGTSAAHDRDDAGIEVDEVERVPGDLRYRPGNEPLAQLLLEDGIGDASGRRVRADRRAAGQRSVPYGLPGDGVFAQLIDERADEDVSEEPVDPVHQAPGACRAAPELAPEHREDVDVRDQRTVAIREPRIHRRRVRLAIEEILSFTPQAAELVDRVCGLGMVEWNDAHVLFGGELFLLRRRWARCSGGHEIPPG